MHGDNNRDLLRKLSVIFEHLLPELRKRTTQNSEVVIHKFAPRREARVAQSFLQQAKIVLCQRADVAGTRSLTAVVLFADTSQGEGAR